MVELVSDQTISQVVAEDEKSKSRITFVQKYIEPKFDYLGIDHFKSKLELSLKLKKWIEDFDPEVIYAQSTSREGTLFCIAVQNYLQKPMVYHMMDDWPALIGQKGFMKKYWARKIDKEFKQLLKQTQLPMSICDYMGKEYMKRYGREFITFHNPIAIDFWKKGQRTSYEIDQCPTLLYAGRIGLGIDNSLQAIASAVDQVNFELGISMQFKIQAFAPPNWLSDYKCVVHQNFVDYEDLPKVFGAADFMVLPYDFDPESLRYIKYSMPTKASEYMVSGTPILIYAPENTALVQYAKQHKWAQIITEDNTEKLVEKIKELVENKSLRENYALTAKNLAEQRHNIDIVAHKFQNLISNTIKNDLVDTGQGN